MEVANKAIEALLSCLCCLLRKPHKNLKASYLYQDKTEKYIDMLKECFDVKIDIDSNVVGICEECVGRLRDASNFKVQVQRCQVQLRRLTLEAIRLLEEEPEVKSEIADDETCDSLLDADPQVPAPEGAEREETATHEEPLVPEMADEGTPREESAIQEAPGVKSEMFSEEDETGDNMCHPESPAKSETSDGAASDDSATLGWHNLFGSGALSRAVSARARQQLAMTCAVRLERLHQCRICHNSFDQESALTTHMEEMHTDKFGVHAEEEACTCDTCGEQLNKKIDLIKHLHKHRQKSFKCGICNKLFTRKEGLKRHTRIHTGEKPYRCTICDRKFTQNAFLYYHIRIHTGEKPHGCKLCNMRFTRKGDLNKHIKVHTEQGPYKCEICNKQFTKKMLFNKSH